MTIKVESSCKTFRVSTYCRSHEKNVSFPVFPLAYFTLSVYHKPTTHLTAPLTQRDRNCNIAKTD